ncbi:MAG: MBL fold metallo-hydrolase [Halobacteriota archaeon]|nr:MBL fold metallo-hydrolase [Halobacteriota archaeon]
MQVGEKTIQIKLKMPFSATPSMNVYLVCGDEIALIDTGVGDRPSIETIYKQMESFGNLGMIINTHEHIDHIGGNAGIKMITDSRIAAHKVAAPMIENPGAMSKRGIPPIKPSKVDEYLEDNEIIDLGAAKLRVIHSPGHAPGHICLYNEKEKILFSGDNVLDTATTYVGSGSFGNMTEYLNSLHRLLKLDMKLILPAHGEIIESPYEKIMESIDHKLEREREILELLGKGEKTVDELIISIYKVRFPHFIRGAMIGYLEKLEREEKIVFKRENNKYKLK